MHTSHNSPLVTLIVIVDKPMNIKQPPTVFKFQSIFQRNIDFFEANHSDDPTSLEHKPELPMLIRQQSIYDRVILYTQCRAGVKNNCVNIGSLRLRYYVYLCQFFITRRVVQQNRDARYTSCHPLYDKF